MLEEKQRAGSESEFITSDITEDEIKGAASAIYAAGADTVGVFVILIGITNKLTNLDLRHAYYLCPQYDSKPRSPRKSTA